MINKIYWSKLFDTNEDWKPKFYHRKDPRWLIRKWILIFKLRKQFRKFAKANKKVPHEFLSDSLCGIQRKMFKDTISILRESKLYPDKSFKNYKVSKNAKPYPYKPNKIL